MAARKPDKIEEGFDAFWKLASAYQAAIHSSCSPVVVPSDLYSGSGKAHAFSHMFWDCTLDENEGRQMMIERIRRAQEDIDRHLAIHQSLSQEFYNVNESVNNRSRPLLIRAVNNLKKLFSEYASLVLEHERKLGENSFLEYPTCLEDYPGHWFLMEGYDRARRCSFNPEQNYRGLEREIASLDNAARFLVVSGEELPRKSPVEMGDSGEGIMDTSLRGRLELTIELLRRVEESD